MPFIVAFVLRFLKDRPEDFGMRAHGTPVGWKYPAPVANPVRLASSALDDAWRSGAFWLLAGSFFVCGVSTSGLVH